MMPPEHSRWIVSGGCGLAFLSAAVNAGFLIQLGTSVSHLSGDVSKVAMDAVAGKSRISPAASGLLTAMTGFVLGATVSGFFIHHPTLEFSRPYGRAVAAIGACLILAHFSLVPLPLLSVGLASFSCGLQNALATHYRGMILRTTHVTGLLTDLGANLGMKLRGHDIARWKLLVPAALVLSFFGGAVFGSILTLAFREISLLVFAALYLAGGIGWTFFKHVIRPGRASGAR